jgi:predicted nucleic acid-binding protein
MANHTRVKNRLTSVQVTDCLFTCPIVCGEILFGIEVLPIGRRRQSLENQANNLFSGLICDPIPQEAGDFYARLKREAQKLGKSLDECDLWIAATALALEAILVTSDSDFHRVQGLLGLQLEDWNV